MGGAEHFIEIEQKFDVAPDFPLPGLAGLPAVAAVSAPETFTLAATYYDTPGRRLAAARITLRRRVGGPDAGWHLKLPAGPGRRQEVREPLGEADDEPPPAALTALVAEQAGGEALGPVARLDTTRTVRHLAGGAGQVLAEVADDRVAGWVPAGPEGTGWRRAQTWREIEVELRAGTPGLLAAAADLLLSRGARPAAHGSKLARVLASG